VKQILYYLHLLDIALRSSPTLEHVVDILSMVVFDVAIGERQQSLNDLDAPDGVGRYRNRPMQGRSTVDIRHIRIRAVAQQQIDDLDVAHAGRAVQSRSSHATGARVHLRAVLQQNLAYASVPAPRCVMQSRVAGGVRHVDKDALLQ